MEPEHEEVKTLPKNDNKSVSKKKKIALVTSLIVLIIIAISGFSFWRVQKNEENYNQTMTYTQGLLLTGAIGDVTICEMYSTVWRDAINSRYKDFNTEISNQKSELQKDGTLTKSSELKNEIDENMKKINNPSKKY